MAPITVLSCDHLKYCFCVLNLHRDIIPKIIHTLGCIVWLPLENVRSVGEFLGLLRLWESFKIPYMSSEFWISQSFYYTLEKYQQESLKSEWYVLLDGGYIWLVCWICLSCMDDILSRMERVKIHVFVLSQIIFFQGCCTRLTIETYLYLSRIYREVCDQVQI